MTPFGLKTGPSTPKDIDLRVANLPQVLYDVDGAMLRWMALTGGGTSIAERVRKAYEKSEEVGR
jgi:hypothetical protein